MDTHSSNQPTSSHHNHGQANTAYNVVALPWSGWELQPR